MSIYLLNLRSYNTPRFHILQLEQIYKNQEQYFFFVEIIWGKLFEAKFKITVGKIKQKKRCASAVRESVSKIARKVAEGVIHCAMALQVATMRCEKQTQVLLRVTLLEMKKLRDKA